MTAPLVIEIGSLRIDAIGQPEDAARIETVLREGLKRLAERLASSPLARNPEAMALAIRGIEIDDLGFEDWVGARGAARLAECLYDRITRAEAG